METLANDGRFQQFTQLLYQAGLEEVLRMKTGKGEGGEGGEEMQFTILAPSDQILEEPAAKVRVGR